MPSIGNGDYTAHQQDNNQPCRITHPPYNKQAIPARTQSIKPSSTSWTTGYHRSRSSIHLHTLVFSARRCLPNPIHSIARLLYILISLLHVFLMEGSGVVVVNMAVPCLGHGVDGSLALLEAAWWHFGGICCNPHRLDSLLTWVIITRWI